MPRKPTALRPVRGRPRAAAKAAQGARCPSSDKFSVDDDDDAPKPFPFLRLPVELRLKVYGFFFADCGDVLDLDSSNHKTIHGKLALMRVCRAVHDEATEHFFGSRAVRVFATSPGKYFKTNRPLVARLKRHQRACIRSLELRLGPGWNKPPAGWVVSPRLHLADCHRVRHLRVFAECDPSDRIFNGYRRADGFYEDFSRDLLAALLAALPPVESVELDAYSSVKKSGLMMQRLLSVVRDYAPARVSFGPVCGWTGGLDNPDDDAAPAAGAPAVDKHGPAGAAADAAGGSAA